MGPGGEKPSGSTGMDHVGAIVGCDGRCSGIRRSFSGFGWACTEAVWARVPEPETARMQAATIPRLPTLHRHAIALYCHRCRAVLGSRKNRHGKTHCEHSSLQNRFGTPRINL